MNTQERKIEKLRKKLNNLKPEYDRVKQIFDLWEQGVLKENEELINSSGIPRTLFTKKTSLSKAKLKELHSRKGLSVVQEIVKKYNSEFIPKYNSIAKKRVSPLSNTEEKILDEFHTTYNELGRLENNSKYIKGRWVWAPTRI